MNPADLFTKFICSRDNILQLLELFGCKYREGRAESAPRLRKKMDDEDGHKHYAEATVVNDEDDDTDVSSHDSSVLPHEYAAKDLDLYFPKAKKTQPAWLRTTSTTTTTTSALSSVRGESTAW